MTESILRLSRIPPDVEVQRILDTCEFAARNRWREQVSSDGRFSTKIFIELDDDDEPPSWDFLFGRLEGAQRHLLEAVSIHIGVDDVGRYYLVHKTNPSGITVVGQNMHSDIHQLLGMGDPLDGDIVKQVVDELELWLVPTKVDWRPSGA